MEPQRKKKRNEEEWNGTKLNEKKREKLNANVLTKNCGKITSITKLHSFRSICFIFSFIRSFERSFFSFILANIFRIFVTLWFARV